MPLWIILTKRPEPLNGVLRPADHHAVSALQAPDAAADASVDVADVLGLQRGGTTNIVLEVRVAPIDDQVARPHSLGERHHRMLRDLARGKHHPGGSWRGELA